MILGNRFSNPTVKSFIDFGGRTVSDSHEQFLRLLVREGVG